MVISCYLDDDDHVAAFTRVSLQQNARTTPAGKQGTRGSCSFVYCLITFDSGMTVSGLHFNGHGLASTRTSAFWMLLELRMMEVLVTIGASQTVTIDKPTPSFSLAGCSSCQSPNSVRTLEEKLSHSMYLIIPSSPGDFQLCL